MLTYKDLTNSQKKCIDTFIEYHPELASAAEITSKEVHTIWHEIFNQRSNGAPVLAYPHWLSKNNQIRRGVHSFPSPSGTTSVSEKMQEDKKSLQKIIDSLEPVKKDNSEEEFLDELRANGITV